MELSHFYESILDSLEDAVFVLDDKGNYLYVNSAYVNMLNMPKSELLNYNAHQFLETGQINICVSDAVYRDRKRVVMFQDVYDTQHRGRGLLRNLIVATPIFDETGAVKNVVATVKQLDKLTENYHTASQNAVISTMTPPPHPSPESLMENTAIIAESPAMQEILRLSVNIARADSHILISGESGTGKEVIAQYIHKQSQREDKPFVVINCASLPENLLEAELFGYEKGAFTGALTTGKTGLFEEAHGGTLFLDEVNSLPLNLQGKILRAIETKTIQRVGSTRNRQVDFRLLSATNEDLAALVEERKFRRDLYYRLNVIPIVLPPLRERREDIIPLTRHFLTFYCRKNNKTKTFSQKTLENMRSYDWPGNVRELKNFVERSVVMSFDATIEIHDIQAVASGWTIPPHIAFPHLNSAEMGLAPSYEELLEHNVSLEEYLARCERDYLEYTLGKYKSTYKTAQALGTSQTSIMRRKKKFAL